MNCFDCGETSVDRAAVTSCAACGAGLCTDHAVRHAPPRPPAAVVGMVRRSAPSRSSARAFLCEACTGAATRGVRDAAYVR